MERIGDAFVWSFRDPDWLSKVVIMGLILLIPIVGAIDGLGWMLVAIDRLRAGEEKLPPANFDYLGRGALLFVVFLVYYLGLALVAALLFVPAVVALSIQGNGSGNALLILIGFTLLSLAFAVALLGVLAIIFATPAIVLATDRGGVAAGLDLGGVLRNARKTPINTLIAGLMLIAAHFIGQLATAGPLRARGNRIRGTADRRARYRFAGHRHRLDRLLHCVPGHRPGPGGGDHGFHLPAANLDQRRRARRRDPCPRRADPRHSRVRRGRGRLLPVRLRGDPEQLIRLPVSVTLDSQAPLLKSRCSCFGPGQRRPGDPATASSTA